MVQGPDSHLHFGSLPLTSIHASVEMPQGLDSHLPGSEIDYCYPMGTTVMGGQSQSVVPIGLELFLFAEGANRQWLFLGC